MRPTELYGQKGRLAEKCLVQLIQFGLDAFELTEWIVAVHEGFHIVGRVSRISYSDLGRRCIKQVDSQVKAFL